MDKTCQGGGDASKEALAVCVLEVLEVGVCRHEIVENHVLDQKSESGQHAVALSSEGTGVAARSGTTSFPENL
jgi:hypothetical protein